VNFTTGMPPSAATSANFYRLTRPLRALNDWVLSLHKKNTLHCCLLVYLTRVYQLYA